MEVQTLTLHGDAVDEFASALVTESATVGNRSFNKLGVQNVTRYRGENFTHLAYEQSAAYRDQWVMVSILVEQVDDTTAEVAVLVGGGREGPYRILDLEERLNRREVGKEGFGEAGRLGSVLDRIQAVATDLGLDVERE